jgi:transcriptional regulator with XRE-family HTH domain
MQPAWDLLLKQYRFQHGLTQQEMGCLLGVSQKTVSRWECGENKPSVAQQKQFRDLYREPSSPISDALRAAVHNCPAPRSLCRLENLNLQAVSRPAIAKRPSIVNWIGRSLVPLACGVLSEMLDDGELQRSVASGEIACVNAVTRSVLRVPENPVNATYRTTISFFRIDGIVLCDAISLPAREDLTPGYWAVPLEGLADA